MAPCYGFFKKIPMILGKYLLNIMRKKKKNTCNILKNVMHAYVGIMFFKEASVFFFQKAHWSIIIPMIDVWHLFD